MPSLSRPELHQGELLWVNRDLIDKIEHGDPTLGWEGDNRLAVFLEQRSPEVWALYRLEDDGYWRHVVRTEEGVPFDERVIHWLCQNDIRRKPAGFDLDAIVKEQNEKVRAQKDQENQEYMAEEVAPRLQHALKKDHGW